MSSGMSPFDRAHMTFYSTLTEIMCIVVPISRYGELFVEIRRFYLPHLHLVPSLGVTPFKFRDILWQQKTRVPGLSCGVVYVILRSAGL